ncbi:MAG: ankyrin repeat domain-containing protein, partial [Gammaproteobacteria bacterium]|nr:ankyrin repeat domain-containing protein [Gammaproteobacteria bacterium]
LNKENEDKETFEKTLQTFFILCINERLNKQIINLQEILPDYFKKFAQLPEVLTATINTGFIDALNLIIKNRNFKDDKIDINSLITECTVNNLLYLLKVEKYEEIQEILQKNPDLITRLNENKKSLQSELFEIFLTCIIDENIETLEKIKQSFPDSYHLFLHDNSILFIAIKENKESSLKFLLEEKADPNIKNADNQTPLLYAVSFLNMEMIEILKEYVNDDPSIEYYRQLEQTLLLLIEENKFHEIKSLCDKYKIDIRNTGAMELDRQLWKAASLTVDNAKQILNLFPDAELIDQRWGRLQETLLLLFASENSLEAVQFLLEKKADKELTDNFNYSPLKVAITYRNIQMAGLFASQDNRLDTCEDLIVNCLKFDEYDKIPEIKHYFLSEANQIFENQSADLLSMAVKEEDFAIAFEKVLCLVKNGVNINHLNLNETEIKAEEIQKIYKMKCLLPLEEKDLNHITQRHLALKHIYEEIPVDSFDTAVNNFKELDRLLIELNSFQNMKELEDLIPNCYDEYTKNPDQIQKITKHLLERLIEINNKLPEPKQNNLIFFADPMDNLKQSLTNLINKIEIEISKNLNQRYS